MEENIISKYEPLIYKIARKFYNVELCDLYQAGCIGLIKAYRNYNPSDGTNFINFAYMYIFGEMYDYVNSSKNIKLNKEYLKLIKSINKAEEILFNKLGRSSSTTELSYFLEIDESLIIEILNLNKEPISLEIDNEENNLLNYYGVSENIDSKILIKDSLEELDDLEKQVIVSRYFKDLTQSEIANNLGITQVKVSRLEQRGKEKIKEYIKS